MRMVKVRILPPQPIFLVNRANGCAAVKYYPLYYLIRVPEIVGVSPDAVFDKGRSKWLEQRNLPCIGSGFADLF
jgi:hypothetical protein